MRERLKGLDTVPSKRGGSEVAGKLTAMRDGHTRIIRATDMKGEGQ